MKRLLREAWQSHREALPFALTVGLLTGLLTYALLRLCTL